MPKKKKHFIRVGGELVPVSKRVYLVFHKMKRREKYLVERDAYYGTVMYSEFDMDGITGEEMIPDSGARSVEQSVIDKVMTEKLHLCLGLLPEAERNLIDALFFDGMSERELAKTLGISKTALHARKIEALALLKKFMKN